MESELKSLQDKIMNLESKLSFTHEESKNDFLKTNIETNHNAFISLPDDRQPKSVGQDIKKKLFTYKRGSDTSDTVN